MPDLYRLDIMVNEEDFPLAQALVAEVAEMGWEEESLPTGDMLLRVTCEIEAERDKRDIHRYCGLTVYTESTLKRLAQ